MSVRIPLVGVPVLWRSCPSDSHRTLFRSTSCGPESFRKSTTSGFLFCVLRERLESACLSVRCVGFPVSQVPPPPALASWDRAPVTWRTRPCDVVRRSPPSGGRRVCVPGGVRGGFQERSNKSVFLNHVSLSSFFPVALELTISPPVRTDEHSACAPLPAPSS